MPLAQRREQFSNVEKLRDGRKLIAFFNFDRHSLPDQVPGLATHFAGDAKEPLFRVLKESAPKQGIDICLYSHGGDINAVWPLVSLVREFDPDFHVLVPFACHSSGTLFSLGAKRIVLTPLSELSPIDPTGGNQFNPIDELQRVRAGISVEDVSAYREFILKHLSIKPDDKMSLEEQQLYQPFLGTLAGGVHPLALGYCHRMQQQGRRLAEELLKLHEEENGQEADVVDKLSSKFFSHQHMINREEAKNLLGDKVEFAGDELSAALDSLLHQYEIDFHLRRPFVPKGQFTPQKPEIDARFIGGAIESNDWSYLFETKLKLRYVPKIPQNISIQLNAGQSIFSVPGFPRQLDWEFHSQAWTRNEDPPKGVTV